MPEVADKLIDRQQSLASERGTWESHWQELADYMRPTRSDFQVTTRTKGSKRRRKIYDSSALIASEQLAAGLWGMVTSPSTEWAKMRARDPDLNDKEAVQKWLDSINTKLHQVFAQQGLRFYTKVHEMLYDLVVFGTGIFFVGEDPIRFSTIPLSQCFISENEREQVDTLYRRFKMTAHQMVERWEDAAGKDANKAVKGNKGNEEFDVLHAVFPRDGRDMQKIDAQNKPFASVYVNVTEKIIMSEGGFDEFPYMVPRWVVTAGETYGRSPGMAALADVKMLNAMSRTTIVSAQKIADPPLLAPDDGTIQGFRANPGDIVYGGVNSAGQQMVSPLQTGGRPDLGFQMEEQRRAAIRDAFYNNLLVLAERSNMTATEVIERQQERFTLLGPHFGRIQSEFLEPLINRVFAILEREGTLPTPPEDILGSADGDRVDVDYVSSLALAGKVQDAQSIANTLAMTAQIASIDGEVVDLIDGDESVKAAAKALGAPVSIIRDSSDVRRRRDARRQQQQAQQAAEQAQPVASAAKDAADALKTVREDA